MRGSIVVFLFWLFVACDQSEIAGNLSDNSIKDSIDTIRINDSIQVDTLIVVDSSKVEEDTIIAAIDTIFGPPADLVILENAIHFYVFGDFGRRGEFGQLQLARMMDTVSTVLPPDFVVSTGDNFYSDGVTSVEDPLWQASYEAIYSTRNGLNCPWYLVLGNHDYHTNPEAQIEYSRMSSRWNMPAHYFSKDFEKTDVSIRMAFLDTNPFIDELYTQGKFKNKIILQDTTYRLKWLDSLFTDSPTTWKIAVGHHPIYCGSDEGGELRSMRNHVEPHLRDNGVNIYFNGHVHVIHHAKPEGPTHYFTSGAGSKTETAHEIPQTVFAKEVSAFVLASATTDSIYLQVIDYRGEVVYRTSIKSEN